MIVHIMQRSIAVCEDASFSLHLPAWLQLFGQMFQLCSCHVQNVLVVLCQNKLCVFTAGGNCISNLEHFQPSVQYKQCKYDLIYN